MPLFALVTSKLPYCVSAGYTSATSNCPQSLIHKHPLSTEQNKISTFVINQIMTKRTFPIFEWGKLYFYRLSHSARGGPVSRGTLYLKKQMYIKRREHMENNGAESRLGWTKILETWQCPPQHCFNCFFFYLFVCAHQSEMQERSIRVPIRFFWDVGVTIFQGQESRIMWKWKWDSGCLCWVGKLV